MASFEYPPLTPDPDPAPLSPSIPLNPPMVGEASPFDHVDGQNRDLILESIRSWIRNSLLPWTKAWQAYLVYWLALVAGWLDEFVSEVSAYITEYAVSGYSWRTTATPISQTGSTTVAVVVGDPTHRPLVVGDLISDETDETNYGIVTSVVDPTHAVVSWLGSLAGLPGHGWWTTATPINATGPTNVTIALDNTRPLQVGDFVSDESSALRFGQITALIDTTHATVTPLGQLRGLAGFGWWTTATTIGQGSTAVVLATGPDRAPQVNDLVVDNTTAAHYGEITAVTDATHVTVLYIGSLQGPSGIAGSGTYTESPMIEPGATDARPMSGMPNMVGAYEIELSMPAWVRVYAGADYLNADADRSIDTPLDISLDHGCYLDFVGTADELTKVLTPGIMFTNTGDGLWISIQNTGTAAAVITVTIPYRTFLE